MKDLKEVIKENSKLIYSIASKFRCDDIDDLFQAGCIGMIEAYKNFDVSRNVKFTTFAYPYILGRVAEYVREDHNIKLSRDMFRCRRKVDLARVYLAQKLMREPNYNELSDYLNIPLENLIMLINYNGDGFSLDEPYLDDLSLYDVISNENIDYDSLLFLKEEIASLDEPERTIMFQRYFEDMTQSEIAKSLGLTQAYVSRSEKRVLTKLRKTFN